MASVFNYESIVQNQRTDSEKVMDMVYFNIFAEMCGFKKMTHSTITNPNFAPSVCKYLLKEDTEKQFFIVIFANFIECSQNVSVITHLKNANPSFNVITGHLDAYPWLAMKYSDLRTHLSSDPCYLPFTLANTRKDAASKMMPVVNKMGPLYGLILHD